MPPLHHCIVWLALLGMITAEAVPDAEAAAEADAEADPQYQSAARPPYNPGCGLMDTCCGMSNEGCCMGGQQCYTYYENVCENVNEPQCNMKGREFCEPVTLPDCRVTKERGKLTVMEESCSPTPKRECFEYTRTVCDKKATTVYEPVTWQNERLEKTANNNKTKCQMVTRCNYTTEERVEQRSVPRTVCDNRTEIQEFCKNVPVTEYRIETRTDFVIQYVQDCRVVSQPVCSASACAPTGCLNGGSVCSSVDYNMTTVCAQGLVNSPCQQVQQPVCYGDQPSCNYANQQCCVDIPRRVCQPVAQRIPTQRNVTLPYVTTKRQCSQQEIARPDCRVQYETQNYTTQARKCNEITVEDCFSIAIPQYSVRSENKTERVPFTVIKCEKRTEKAPYCRTFPNADFTCKPRPSVRMFILNKVVCDRRRDIKLCRIIPESACRNSQRQKCRAVPRQVCQPTCNPDTKCNQCDNFRAQGGFSQCNSGTCPNFYPADSYVNMTGGDGSYPGYGDDSFNPGYGVGGDEFNPGYGGGGDYFNPGYGGGEDAYNPGYGGGDYYNPGYSGGDEFNPGYGGGGDEFNPGYGGGDGYNPGYDGVDGYNPGYGGGNAYNPGQNFYPLSPWDGNQGYNPGYPAGGGQGFNPGLFYPASQVDNQGFNPGQNQLAESQPLPAN